MKQEATEVPHTRHRLNPHPSGWGARQGLVLGLLVATYLLSAFRAGRAVTVVRLAVFVLTLLLTLRTSGVRPRLLHQVMGFAVAGGLVTGLLTLAGHSRIGWGLAHVWVAAVLAVIVVVVVGRVLSHRVVTTQTILGAISAYVVVGLLFAALYGAFGEFSSRPFFSQTGSNSLTLCQYFSFTTLTTLGYGDLTPATNAGRAVAMVEALSGQVFLVTLVARLVSLFPTDQGRARTPRTPHTRQSEKTGQVGRSTRIARGRRRKRRTPAGRVPPRGTERR